MEFAALVSVSFGSLGQFQEVFGSLGDIISEQTDNDTSSFLSSNRDVEEDLLGDGDCVSRGGEEKAEEAENCQRDHTHWKRRMRSE